MNEVTPLSGPSPETREAINGLRLEATALLGQVSALVDRSLDAIGSLERELVPHTDECAEQQLRAIGATALVVDLYEIHLAAGRVNSG